MGTLQPLAFGCRRLPGQDSARNPLCAGLVKAGHSMAAVDAAPGVADQTLFNWVKAAREDRLAGMDTQPASPEPMALARLRAEAARLKMAHDVPRKRPNIR
ncbi:transposase (plasmid) [Ralstonia solanacearum]|nr:transposase [Ralstonia pseudosolanacearum]QWQ14597.1 transposase [Ralstonia solanacearum]